MLYYILQKEPQFTETAMSMSYHAVPYYAILHSTKRHPICRNSHVRILVYFPMLYHIIFYRREPGFTETAMSTLYNIFKNCTMLYSTQRSPDLPKQTCPEYCIVLSHTIPDYIPQKGAPKLWNSLPPWELEQPTWDRLAAGGVPWLPPRPAQRPSLPRWASWSLVGNERRA